MSRYDLPCHRPDDVAVVGWVNPLSTFFAEVFRVRAGRRTSVLWLGDRPRQIKRADDLVEPLTAYAMLDDAMLHRLWNNFTATLDCGPTPLQRQGRRTLALLVR